MKATSKEQTATVIEKGIFKNYLYDQKYALNMNEMATGNGLKSLSGMTNIMNKYMLRFPAFHHTSGSRMSK